MTVAKRWAGPPQRRSMVMRQSHSRPLPACTAMAVHPSHRPRNSGPRLSRLRYLWHQNQHHRRAGCHNLSALGASPWRW